MISCALGLAAMAAQLLCTDLPIAPGIFFLFLAAAAFGLEGAALALIAGVLPLAILSGEFIAAGRLLVLTLVVGAWQTFGFRRTGILAVGVSWNILIGCVLALGAVSPATFQLIHNPETRAFCVVLFLNDLVAITAACVWLSTDVGWYSLVKRSRISSSINTVILLVTTAALLMLTACVSLGWEFARTSHGSIAVLFLATCAVVIPSSLFLVSNKLLKIFRDDSTDSHSELTAGLNSERDHGFSGHSAMFWRRKALTESKERSASSESLMQSGQQVVGFGADSGVCVLDGTGAVTLANRKFIKLVSAPDREPIGKPFTSWAMTAEISRTFVDLVMHPAPVRRTREVRLAQIPNSNLSPERQLNYVNSGRFFELSVIPGALAPGSLQGSPGTVVLVIREVTDSRAIEWSLLQSQKLASLGSVVTGIGHAFNSALTTIIGRASHARLVSDPTAMVEGLNAIIAEAQRAGTFVNKLLDFANDSPRAKTIFDARQFVSERRELFKNVLGTEHILELAIPERTLGIACDPNLLTQVITNLLLNARDAMSKKTGRVLLSLGVETIDPDAALLNVSAYPGTFVRLRVADSGEGMSSDVLKHACEPTFTTRGGGGHTGLGLPTAFAVARAHDGFLTLESAPERGTTISVYLPEVTMAQAETADRAKQTSPVLAQLFANAPSLEDSENNISPPVVSESTGLDGLVPAKRVLVLEDEPMVRELVAGMLSALGAEVVACAKPQDALDLAVQKPFDVAFIDLVMPTMGGNEWVTNLRAQTTGANPQLPVVLMTGYGALGDHNSSIHSVLPKPFTMDDLKATLSAAAASRK